MNKKERAIKAIELKKPDVVPVALHNFQMCAQASGKEWDIYFKSADDMAEMQIGLWNKFGHDILMLENGTAALAESLGCEVIYRKNQVPAVHSYVLVDINDVDKLKMQGISESEVLVRNLRATSIVNKKIKDDALVMGRGDQGPFSLASMLLGMENLLIEVATRENDALIHKLLDFCTDYIIKYTLAQLSEGAYCTSIGDSTAGPDVVSPDIYREFAFPYEKRIVEAVHNSGGKIALHICGNATPILEDMILTGADIIEIDQKTDFAKACRLASERTAVLGQVSPDLLRRGKKEEVRDAVRESLKIAGCEGGYILGAGCAIAGDTPWNNVFELIKVRDEGIF